MDDRPPHRAWHPLTAAFVATLVAQVAGLFAHYFGTDDAGHRVYSSPLNMLMIAVPLYVSWLFVLGALFSVLWVAVPRLRAAVTAAGLALAFALLWLVPADFAMQHFRGERLTLAQMRDYGLGALFNGDVTGPVLRHLSYPAVTLGIPLVALGLFVWLWRAARGRAVHAPSWRAAGSSAVLAAACYAPTMFAYYHQRDMAQPPEVDWALQLLPRAPAMPPGHEAGARDDLRGFLDPRGGSTWLSDSFPLVRSGGAPGAAGARSPGELPDIILFVVESLRGRDVGYGLYPPAPGTSPTPRLDALARASVVFPRYIANGEPSPRGFITINAGVWEHESEFIIADFPNLTLDALPNRLRAHGYHTMALWGGNPSFDNQLAWARRWYDEVDFELPGNGLFYFHTRPDTLVVDHLLARVRAHDVAAPEQPLFAYVSTNGTHTPYQPEDGTAQPGEGPAERYARCLRNIDRQIGRVLDFLQTRRRAANTIVIVVGDHGDRTDESYDERYRGLPNDAAVWTSALVHGPSRFVGAPRREGFTASHVDLLPTVLRWVGDTAPRVTFGHDLFAPVPDHDRAAVSINSRGYRLDRDGYTLLVDRGDPAHPLAFPSFPRGEPVPVPLSQTPFAPDEARRLVRRIDYWTSLIQRDRVWRDRREGAARLR